MCQMGMRDHRRCQSSPSGWWWLLPGPPASAGCRSRDQVDRTYQLAHTAARRSGAPSSSTMPIRGIFAPCWARAPIGHATAPPPSRVKNSRRLVCRERSIVRGDEGRIMTRPSSRPEARRRLVCRERSIVRGDEGRIMTRPSSRPEARRRLIRAPRWPGQRIHPIRKRRAMPPSSD